MGAMKLDIVVNCLATRSRGEEGEGECMSAEVKERRGDKYKYGLVGDRIQGMSMGIASISLWVRTCQPKGPKRGCIRGLPSGINPSFIN